MATFLSPSLGSFGFSISDDEAPSHECSVYRMDRNEGIIRWSPNTSRDEFMHINLNHRIVQVYAATGHAKPGRFDYEKRSKHSEFSHLNTYDWSPHSRGLVAVGTANGEVQVLRVDDDSNASVTLPLKLQRSCQTVAFNTTGLLAVGLDRVRNDACLQIWDVNQRLGDWNTSKPGFDLPKSSGEPTAFKKLEASLSVTSVRFFEDQPQTLIAGIKNSSLRIHDLRDPSPSVLSFTTRCNNNLAIDYVDSNYVASSSLDMPGFVVWDRRATSRTVCSSSYLQAIDEDKESLGTSLGSVLNIKSGIRSGNASIKQLRFSREQAGALGILSTAGELRICQTRKEFVENDEISQTGPSLLEIKHSYDLQYPYDDPLLPKRYEDRIVSFDWMNVGTKDLEARVIALRANGKFEILTMPTATADHLSQLTAWEPPHRLGENHLSAVKFSSRAEQESNIGPLIATVLKEDVPIFGPDNYKNLDIKTQLSAEVKAIVHQTSDHVIDFMDPSVPMVLESASSKSKTTDKRTKDAMAVPIENAELIEVAKESQKSEPSTMQHDNAHYATHRAFPGSKQQHELYDKVMLRRAKNGYLFDSNRNMSIVSEDGWLQDVWEWVSFSEKAAADDGMIAGSLDLSYLGIHTIWTNSLGEQTRTRLIETGVEPDSSQWERLIAKISQKANYLPWDGVDTSKPHHRELCLALCGLSQPISQLEQTLSELRDQRLFTKAAALALFRGANDLAVDILKDGGHELVFIGLALAMKLSSVDSSAVDSGKWIQTLSNYSIGADPFLKAICTFITTGSLDSITSQTSLPLRYRLGIALRTYDDTQLTTFLQEETESAIKTGSIEGIMLTGITESFVDILATYIAKFSDYQTPILLMSFCSPRYLTDIRCEAWRKAYSAFLHRHKEFVLRIQFEQGAAKKSRQRDGKALISPPPRQVTIRCLTCDSAVASDLSNTGLQPTNPGTSHTLPESRNPMISSEVNAGLSCPKCGSHLARCAVCMEHVGVARSDRPELSSDPVIRREARFPTFCMKCRHVMHLDHANAWFGRHVECPVSECSCQCNFVPAWDRGLGA